MGQTFYIETFGCATNKSDSEIVIGLLESMGLRLIGDPSVADFIIVNTCVVKEATERKVLRRIAELSRIGGSLIVGGCLPPLCMEKMKAVAPNFAAALCPRSIDKIVDAVEEVRGGKTNLTFFSDKTPEKPRLPRRTLSKVSGIVQIAEGCIGSCTYCCVRFARGPLHSYAKDDLISEARSILEDGCRELWITAQDTAAYGLDGESSLPELLNDLCALPYRFMIRVGMMNPKNVLPIVDDLIKAYKNGKIYKFLHLPVQSGDDDILSAMGRGYTIQDFVGIVKRFRRPFPRMTLATDVIAGFPGETESQFRHSMDVITRVKPDIVNVSRFGPRPRATATFYSRQLHGRETKQRSRKMTRLTRKIGLDVNLGWVGWRGKALVAEVGDKGGFVARNYAYKPIVVKGKGNILGHFVNLTATSATPSYLVGNLLS